MALPICCLFKLFMSLPCMDFPSGSAVKNPPAMQETQETWVRSLGQEDSLEKGMATHASILAWKKSHGQRSLAGYSPWGCRIGHNWVTEHIYITSFPVWFLLFQKWVCTQTRKVQTLAVSSSSRAVFRFSELQLFHLWKATGIMVPNFFFLNFT